MIKQVLVKVVLKGRDAEKFEVIKKHHGVLHNSEVIRILINQNYDEKEA